MKKLIIVLLAGLIAIGALWLSDIVAADAGMQKLGCITDQQCEDADQRREGQEELTDAECEDLGADCEDLDERRAVHSANVCLRMDSATFCAKKYLSVEIICKTRDGRGCHAESRGSYD
jgi:hypothetical protein